MRECLRQLGFQRLREWRRKFGDLGCGRQLVLQAKTPASLPQVQIGGTQPFEVLRVGLDQLAVLNRDEKTPVALSASFTLQAVRLASRLICVALRFVFSVL